MTAAELLPILQSISSLAIAGGFIFSALQFRNWRKAAHVANFTRLVELQMHLREMRVKDPDLADVYRHDVQDLHSDRDVREYFFNLMQLSIYEIVWFSHKEGQLPEDYYKSWEKRMHAIAAEPSFRKMMSSPAMKIMHDGFQEYITGLVSRVAERPKLY